MPSSVMLGSRPRICWMRAYSSRVTPCSAAISGVTLISALAVAISKVLSPFSRFSARDSVQIRPANRSAECRVPRRPSLAFEFPGRSSLPKRRETPPPTPKTQNPNLPPPSQYPPHPLQRQHSRDCIYACTSRLHVASHRRDKASPYCQNLQTRRKILQGPAHTA